MLSADPKKETTTDRVNDDLILTQRSRGLKFGTDALLLASFVPAARRPLAAAELGSGTGILSLLLLSRNKAERVFCYEVQPAYAALTRENAEKNGLSDRMRVFCRDIRDASPADCGGELDLVVSNPPYLAAGAGLPSSADEKNIARREIFGGIGDFCAAAARLLRTGGSFFLVYRPERLAALFGALDAASLSPKKLTLVSEYPSAAPSLLLMEAKKGAGEGLEITRPLFLRDGPDADAYSADAAAIYEGKTIFEKG